MPKVMVVMPCRAFLFLDPLRALAVGPPPGPANCLQNHPTAPYARYCIPEFDHYQPPFILDRTPPRPGRVFRRLDRGDAKKAIQAAQTILSAGSGVTPTRPIVSTERRQSAHRR